MKSFNNPLLDKMFGINTLPEVKIPIKTARQKVQVISHTQQSAMIYDELLEYLQQPRLMSQIKKKFNFNHSVLYGRIRRLFDLEYIQLVDKIMDGKNELHVYKAVKDKFEASPSAQKFKLVEKKNNLTQADKLLMQHGRIVNGVDKAKWNYKMKPFVNHVSGSSLNASFTEMGI